MRPVFELAPVLARLGGRIGACSSSPRAVRLVGGGGGAAIELLVFMRPGESVVRRGGGAIAAGEALFVRLGAGGGGAGDEEVGVGCELLWPRRVVGLGAGLGGAGLRRVCFMRWGVGPESSAAGFTPVSSSSRSEVGAVLRKRA